jgi:hypothetical protein
MVVVGLWTNRAPAQMTATPPGHLFVVPTTPYEPAYVPWYPSPLMPPAAPPPAQHFWTRGLNHCGMACEADNFGSCGNIHSEARWIFGSCHSFFGETCYPWHSTYDKRYYGW